jgi:hypothetical protein
MGCHMCWTELYKQKRKEYLKDRKARGETVRIKANEPMLCPCCNQPCNSHNEAQEAWNA